MEFGKEINKSVNILIEKPQPLEKPLDKSPTTECWNSMNDEEFHNYLKEKITSIAYNVLPGPLTLDVASNFIFECSREAENKQLFYSFEFGRYFILTKDLFYKQKSLQQTWGEWLTTNTCVSELYAENYIELFNFTCEYHRLIKLAITIDEFMKMKPKIISMLKHYDSFWRKKN